jgi:predicted ATPase
MLQSSARFSGPVRYGETNGRRPNSCTGFLTRQRRSSVESEGEWAFAHMLLRDVAYGQIPRGERAEKHRLVAEWIDSLGRPEDHGEMLAHHWRAALELARVAGRDPGDLAQHTRLALRGAGDRAFALNAYGAAEGYYEEALALWPPDDDERPDLLFRRAHALHLTGDERREPAL